jgi:predicted dehydrogenase
MKALKAGVIGLGVGEQHIPAYLREGVEILKICDFQQKKLTEVSERYPSLATTLNPDDVLTDPCIDIVSIASWDDAHYSQIVKALEHNKHVFVEKPLCLFEWEAREIRALLKQKSELRLASNLILRCSPRFIDLRSKIQNGDFGRIYYLEGDYNYGRIHKIVEGWRGQLPFYSIVLGGGVHLIDLMRWLSNDEIVSVTAMGNQIVSKDTDFNFPDLVVALLQFRSGLIGKMTVNFGCVYPHFHPFQVYGTEASFINRLQAAELYTSRDPLISPMLLDNAYPGTEKGALLQGFVKSLQTQKPTPVSEDEVFATLSVCFAIDKAIKSGEAVHVDYI